MRPIIYGPTYQPPNVSDLKSEDLYPLFTQGSTSPVQLTFLHLHRRLSESSQRAEKPLVGPTTPTVAAQCTAVAAHERKDPTPTAQVGPPALSVTALWAQRERRKHPKGYPDTKNCHDASMPVTKLRRINNKQSYCWIISWSMYKLNLKFLFSHIYFLLCKNILPL